MVEKSKTDFVSKIVKDPKQPPETILLIGYLGDSSEEGSQRLYLDLSLNDYVEISTDSILHSEEVRGGDGPFPSYYVWVKRDAEMVHGGGGASRTKAKFFEGRIQQEYQKAAGGTQAQQWYRIPTLNCTMLTCPTRVVYDCYPPPPPQITWNPLHCPTSMCPPRTQIDPFCGGPGVMGAQGGQAMGQQAGVQNLQAAPQIAPSVAGPCIPQTPLIPCKPYTINPPCNFQTSLLPCITRDFWCPPPSPVCPRPTPFCPIHTVSCPIQTAFCPNPTTFCPIPTLDCPFGGFPGGGGLF